MANTFDGLRVVTFESRRSGEMAGLIGRLGGVAVAAPSLREVPLEESAEVTSFARELLAGRIDIVIFMTGVGARALMTLLEKQHPREQILAALRATTRVARGPKPVPVLREWGTPADIVAPEPNTWHEVVAAMSASVFVADRQDAGPTAHRRYAGAGVTPTVLAGKRIAIQEYGEPSEELAEALRAMGAEVVSVQVYTWALPEDLAPLKDAIGRIAAGDIEVAVFTSAQQARNVLAVAREMGCETQLRAAIRRTLIGSIGPTCSAALREFGLGVDFEPDRGRMTDLISGLARSGRVLLGRKRASAEAGVDVTIARRADMVWPASVSPAASANRLQSSPFLRACRRERADYTPIWIMRQAGRFLREYREMRAKVSFLELCRTPELAAEATLMPIDRLGVDAAIIFADILLVAEPLGVGLSFDAGEGPRIHRPVRTRQDVNGLKEVDPAELGYVYEAVRLTRRALKPDVPLIGFCGAPFTVASYIIEGGGSRNFVQTKTLMYRDAGAWHALMEHLVRALAGYVNGQIAAGAQAVQLFDSWVGCLSAADFRAFVLPHMKSLISAITPGVPVIYFGTDTAVLLRAMREAGPSVVGLDWRIDLAEGWASVGYDVAVQGNLDPAVLFATPSEIQRRAREVLDKAGGRAGHIFNLGHGVLPETPVDHVLALVDAVHEYARA
jgi:uroporphyrinogen decarboxylase